MADPLFVEATDPPPTSEATTEPPVGAAATEPQIIVAAIGSGTDPTGQYHWTTECATAPDDGLIVFSNLATSVGNLTFYSAGTFRVLAPGQSDVVGYLGTEVPAWSIGLGGWSEAPTIVDSGSFSECAAPPPPPSFSWPDCTTISNDGEVALYIRTIEDAAADRVEPGASLSFAEYYDFVAVYDQELEPVASNYPQSCVFSSACSGMNWVITSTGQQVLFLSGTGLPSGVVLSPAGDSEIIPFGVNQVTITNGVAQQLGTPTRPPACTPVVPSAPRTLTATPGAGLVRLNWLAPASNGGAAITDYVVQKSPNGSTGWVTVPDGVNTNTTLFVPSLANGVRYYFRVIAVNAVGSGAASNVVNATPRTVPTAPRSLVAAPTNVSGQVRLSWLAPTSNGGAALTDYVIERSVPGSTAWTVVNDGVRTTTTYVVSGLTNGTRYYFRVSARNVAGTSPTSGWANAIPRTVPSAPRSLTATPGTSGQVRLAWYAPAANGGAAITDYVVQRSPNGSTGWVTVNDGVRSTTGYTVAGLTNGTRYYFRVAARNAAGTGPYSNVVSQVPRTVPGAPTVRATAGNGRVTVSWTPGASGGSPITRFAIQRSTSPTTGWVYVSSSTPATTRTVVVTNLRNGVRYYFRVVAVNAAGIGAWSAPVSAVPVAPAAPTPPRPATPPTTTPPAAYYANCDAVRAAGRAPLYAGQPGYRAGLDRDRDGVACE